MQDKKVQTEYPAYFYGGKSKSEQVGVVLRDLEGKLTKLIPNYINSRPELS